MSWGVQRRETPPVLCLLETPRGPSLPGQVQLSTTATRRAALAAAPALLAPLAAVAVGENKVGYACRGTDDCGVDKASIARLTATPGSGSAAGVRFGGTYTDPQHPGCTRKVVLTGSNVVITGADEPGGKEWKVKGKPYGRALLIDFTPKGGPPDVIARWTGLGLEFPDGNKWTKK